MPGLLIESSFHPLGEPHGIAHGCLPRFQYPIYNPGDIMDGFLIYNIPQIIDGIHRFQSIISGTLWMGPHPQYLADYRWDIIQQIINGPSSIKSRGL